MGKGTKAIARTPGAATQLPTGPVKRTDLTRGFRDVEGAQNIRKTLEEITKEGERRMDMDMMKGTQTPAKRAHFLVANNFFNYLPKTKQTNNWSAIDGQLYTNRKRYCKRGMVGGPMY